MQFWAEATSAKGSELTPEEKWHLGTDLIAKSGDLTAAERVKGETNNYYRLLRVLEIVLHTGKPMADFKPEQDAPLDYDFRWVLLIPISIIYPYFHSVYFFFHSLNHYFLYSSPLVSFVVSLHSFTLPLILFC